MRYTFRITAHDPDDPLTLTYTERVPVRATSEKEAWDAIRRTRRFRGKKIELIQTQP